MYDNNDNEHERSALRSSVRGDFVVEPGHRTDWGLRAFAALCGCCMVPIVGMGCLLNWGSVSCVSETFAKQLKTHLFRV